MTAFTRLLTAAALAPALAAAPATAQSFSPAPSNGTISGVNILVQQSITFQCNISTQYSISPSGQMTLSNESFSPGSFICGFLIQATQNWTVETVPGSTTEVDLTIAFSTITGDVCSGKVRVPFDNATGRIELNNVILPSAGGGPACRVDGDLFTTPRLEIVP